MDWGLYLISDERMLRNGSFFVFLEEACASGARIVQLRAKSMAPDDVLCAGSKIRGITREHGAVFIVNDTPEVAVRLDADGAHLGQTDMTPEEARRILGPDRIIGLSTHNREQVLDAQKRPVDYIGLGPVFPTQTKENADPVTGLELLEWGVANSALPVVAIGGITLQNIDSVVKAGARNAAVISAISQSADPLAETRKFIAKFRSAPER